MTADGDADIRQQDNRERRPQPARMRFLLRAIGIVLVPIGVAGVVLPILPGVPLLILAAACFARSSPKLEHWLLTHPTLGPGVVAWRERGAIPLRAKAFSLPMIAISGVFVYFSSAPLVIKVLVLAGMLGAATFVASRPNH